MRWKGMCLVLTGVCLLTAARLQAEQNNCEQPPKESYYVAQPGDMEDATHFMVKREFAGTGKLEVNVCAGELQIRRSKDGQIHLSIETEKAPELKMRAYVKTLRVEDGGTVISLQFPKAVHPVIALYVPGEKETHSEVNLGAGKLRFYADGIGGDREINLGAGSATLYLAGDRDYSRLEANVGMGSFHDHRPGGGSGHFVISRDLTGKGSAPIEVNVGAGSIDLDPVED